MAAEEETYEDFYEQNVLIPPATKAQVHDAIIKAGANLPRYLFRAWNHSSGGDPDLNTEHEITPAAFYVDEDTPDSLFQVEHQQLIQTISSHIFACKDVHTYFSSWTESLAFALAWAFGNGAMNDATDYYVSIVDTSKLNQALNHVHWCGAKGLRKLGVVDAAEEYQIYGIISDSVAHKAVQLASIQQDILHLPKEMNVKRLRYDINKAPLVLRWSDMSIEEKNESVQCAKRIGHAFGADFGLAVAVFYLSIATPGLDQADDILKSLMFEFSVPAKEWFMDPSIMHGQFDSERATEVEHALQALRALVRHAMVSEGGDKLEQMFERKLGKKPKKVKWKVWEKYREIIGSLADLEKDVGDEEDEVEQVGGDEKGDEGGDAGEQLVKE